MYEQNYVRGSLLVARPTPKARKLTAREKLAAEVVTALRRRFGRVVAAASRDGVSDCGGGCPRRDSGTSTMPSDRPEPARVDLPLGHEFRGWWEGALTDRCVVLVPSGIHEVWCGQPKSAHRAASEPEPGKLDAALKAALPDDWMTAGVCEPPAPVQGSPEHELCGSQACTRTGVHCACHSPHPSGSPDEYEAMARAEVSDALFELEENPALSGQTLEQVLIPRLAALLRSVAQKARADAADRIDTPRPGYCARCRHDAAEEIRRG